MKTATLLFGLMMAVMPIQANENSSLWSMPDCAWTRNMGDRPIFSSTKIYESPGIKPETLTKKGMPVGGIGTGSFMYNMSGSFGPFHMKPGCYEERFLSQAAFHVREETASATTLRTLATEDTLPAWSKLAPGDAEYKALFPKAVFDYKPFKSKISLLHFSPVIRDNYKETSYPVGIFLFKASNPTTETVKLSFMFTFPNAPLIIPDKNAPNMRPDRTDLSNRVIKNDKHTFIVMESGEKGNTQETKNTSWCIGAPAQATWVDVWDGKGDGSDIGKAFSKDGTLPNKFLASQSEIPSGALCVQVELKPGETQAIPFALSWDFPLTSFAEGALWKKRYTEYFPAPKQADGNTASDIACTALDSWDEWLAKVDAWVKPYAENKNAPDWLKAGGLNELYYTTFGGSFWENGCLNQEKRFGNRPGQHIAGVMECMAYPYLETFDVRHHVARVTRDLWPQIEKDILLTYADIIQSTSCGACTHDIGNPHRNPVNNPDAYILDYRRAKGRETTPWSEFSPKFIQQVYMYWKQYKDDDFLNECWPAIVRSCYYQISTDKDNDGITEMTSSEYIDNKLLNAVLWITSLEALNEMATYRNDQETLSVGKAQLAKARPNAEKQFWNEKLGYYQYNQSIPFLMADAFAGQRCADAFGLAPALDEKRMASHFTQCFERLVKPLRDDDGDGVGDMGAANILNPEGKPGIKTSEHNHEYEVWTGVSYNLAASIYHWGKQTNNEELKQMGLLTGKGTYTQCWLNEQNGFWFCTPEAYWFTDMPKARGNMYQRVRGIWELLSETMETSPAPITQK